MREFVESYCQIVDNNNNQVGRVRHQLFQILMFARNSVLGAS
jgi:hypothetical protein